MTSTPLCSTDQQFSIYRSMNYALITHENNTLVIQNWNKQIIIISFPHGTKCFMYQNKNMNNPFRVKPEAITRFACCGVDGLTTFLSSAQWSVLYILQLWGLWTIIIICSNNNNSVLHNTWKTDNKQSPMLIIVIIIKSNSHWLKTEVFRHARMVDLGWTLFRASNLRVIMTENQCLTFPKFDQSDIAIAVIYTWTAVCL